MDLNLLFNKALEFFETGIAAHNAHIKVVGKINTAVPATPEAPAEAGEKTTPSGWNPFAEKVQGKYGKDKQDILDLEIKNRGVKVKDKATGAEKHQALLDHMAKEVASGALEGSTDQEIMEETTPPADDTPPVGDEDFGGDDFGAETPKEEPKAKKYNKEEVRAALMAWRDKHHKGDNAAVREILTKVAGTANFPAVKEDQYPAVMAALEA